MANILPVEIDKSTKELVHDHGSFALVKMLPLQNEVEQLAALAVSSKKNERTT